MVITGQHDDQQQQMFFTPSDRKQQQLSLSSTRAESRSSEKASESSESIELITEDGHPDLSTFSDDELSLSIEFIEYDANDIEFVAREISPTMYNSAIVEFVKCKTS